MENPNGILFNPVSITRSVISYIEDKRYIEDDLFYYNECWHSWDHHSRFSHSDKDKSLQAINNSQELAHNFLRNADWVLVTLGSAFVYERGGEQVVANCHKVPADKFNKKLLSAEEIYEILDRMVQETVQFNPSARMIFTISPVRHLRDGFVENNRSKAALITAVHKLVENSASENIFYFPAYELVIDDLRDYRFFAEDMVHPNYTATNYVWEKFVQSCIDLPSRQIMKQLNEINAAKSHRPFNPDSEQHKKFLDTNLGKVNYLRQLYPYIDFAEEVRYFSR